MLKNLFKRKKRPIRFFCGLCNELKEPSKSDQITCANCKRSYCENCIKASIEVGRNTCAYCKEPISSFYNPKPVVFEPIPIVNEQHIEIEPIVRRNTVLNRHTEHYTLEDSEESFTRDIPEFDREDNNILVPDHVDAYNRRRIQADDQIDRPVRRRSSLLHRERTNDRKDLKAIIKSHLQFGFNSFRNFTIIGGSEKQQQDIAFYILKNLSKDNKVVFKEFDFDTESFVDTKRDINFTFGKQFIFIRNVQKLSFHLQKSLNSFMSDRSQRIKFLLCTDGTTLYNNILNTTTSYTLIQPEKDGDSPIIQEDPILDGTNVGDILHSDIRKNILNIAERDFGRLPNIVLIGHNDDVHDEIVKEFIDTVRIHKPDIIYRHYNSYRRYGFNLAKEIKEFADLDGERILYISEFQDLSFENQSIIRRIIDNKRNFRIIISSDTTARVLHAIRSRCMLFDISKEVKRKHNQLFQTGIVHNNLLDALHPDKSRFNIDEKYFLPLLFMAGLLSSLIEIAGINMSIIVVFLSVLYIIKILYDSVQLSRPKMRGK